MRAGIGKVLVEVTEEFKSEGVQWGRVVNMGLGTKLGMAVSDCDVAFSGAAAFPLGDNMVVVAEENILVVEPRKKVVDEPVEEEGKLTAEDIKVN